jgi:hypothetical protein
MTTAAARRVASAVTVAAACRGSAGWSAYAVGFAKRRKHRKLAFGFARIPTTRTFDFAVFGANSAQSLVGRAALGTSVCVNRHFYLFIQQLQNTKISAFATAIITSHSLAYQTGIENKSREIWCNYCANGCVLYK